MIKILHLYPNLMNLYGDYGNVALLCKHLKDQGVKVKVDKKEIDEIVNFFDYDFIYMGSGTEKNQKVALKALHKYNNVLKSCAENNKVMLFTGNAMELLGSKIDEEDGLGLFDFTVNTTEKRYTGDVIVYNEEIGDVVGFVNKSSIIEGSEKDKLFTYKFKDSNLLDNEYEGYRYNNLFGTHIIGPVLVKNPNFMRLIMKLLLAKDYHDIRYDHEEKAYETNLNGLGKRM